MVSVRRQSYPPEKCVYVWQTHILFRKIGLYKERKNKYFQKWSVAASEDFTNGFNTSSYLIWFSGDLLCSQIY